MFKLDNYSSECRVIDESNEIFNSTIVTPENYQAFLNGDFRGVDAFEKKHNLQLGPPLYKEMGRHESETSVVECHLCDSTFTQKSSLRQHLWAVHLKKKPYKCKHCDFVGAYKR